MIQYDSMHVVVACRTFDLEHDPQIRSWRQASNGMQLVRDYKVGDFPGHVARSVVEASGISWSEFGEQQRHLLQIPLHLYLWVSLDGDQRVRLSFRSLTDLMRAYWQHVRRKLEEIGVPLSESEAALRELANRLDSDGRLTAPARLLDRWPRIVRSLMSLHVVELVGNSIRFAHQTYFEYYLAEIWLDRLATTQQTVGTWLSSMDEQSLLRRGQLRQLLPMLRDDDPSRFLEAVREIFSLPNVRFHLRQLTLQVLGQLPAPTPSEVTFITSLLEDPAWRDSVAAEVLWGRVAWFDALDAGDTWKNWIESCDAEKVKIAQTVLSLVLSWRGDRVAAILTRYEELPAPWPDRIQSILGYNADLDTEGIFRLRIRMARRGTLRLPRHLVSERLVEREPNWVIDALAASLAVADEVDDFSTLQGNSSDFWPFWLPHHLVESVRKAALNSPTYFWQSITGPVLVTCERFRDNSRLWDRRVFESDVVWQQDLYKHDHSGSRPLPELLALAGARWLQSDRAAATGAVALVSASPSRTAQQLIATVWLNCSDSEADEAIRWFVEDPRRFSLGRFGEELDHWRLARDVISRFSRYCSDECYAALEHALLGYYSSRERDQFRYNLQTKSIGRPIYGFTQHALLPALPPHRRSLSVANAIGQLLRKFKEPADDMDDERRHRGGFVRSPINDRRRLLSDNAWLGLINSNEVGRSLERMRFGGGQVIESSTEAFSRDFRLQAEENPRRFASIVNRIRPGAPSRYFAALLDVVSLTQVPAHAEGAWFPASSEDCCRVLRRVGYVRDQETAWAFCRCVEARSDLALPDDILSMIARFATEHPNPAPGEKAFLGESRDRLDIESINTVRGAAASAIAAILFRMPSRFELLSKAVAHLIEDPVPAIRVGGIGTLVPMLNFKREEAVKNFVRACDDATDEVLCSHNARQFLRHAIWSHPPQLAPLLDRMLISRLPAVVEDGAAWTTLVWLYSGSREAEFTEAMRGNVYHRRGIAGTLADQLIVTEVSPKCHKYLPLFFDDEDKQVREASSSFMRNDVNLGADDTPGLLQRYVSSRAFLDEPTLLIWRLENFAGDLRPMARVILAACDQFAGAGSANNTEGPWEGTFEVQQVSLLLLRLYGQADEGRDLRKQCLDRWDSALRSGTRTIRAIAASLDR